MPWSLPSGQILWIDFNKTEGGESRAQQGQQYRIHFFIKKLDVFSTENVILNKMYISDNSFQSLQLLQELGPPPGTAGGGSRDVHLIIK